MMRAGLLLLAWAVSAAASGSNLELPESVFQGALVKGRAAPGSVVDYGDRTVRVDADGRFVLGVGRDAAGPLEIRVTTRDGVIANVEVTVVARPWKIENITGVPEKTVNPPPAIAARIAREQAEVGSVRSRDDAREDFDTAFIWPVRGRISGVYGSQRIYNGTPKSPHSGVDVAATEGTPVKAPAGGIVTFAKPGLYLTGGTVLIDHGHGVSSNFLHLSRIDVKVGDRIEQGQVLGLVGATGRATGPHMHWGMNWFDVRIDPQLLVNSADNPQAKQ